MEMQGGSERYGGPGGTETPTDTPTKATAAQLARRKSVNINASIQKIVTNNWSQNSNSKRSKVFSIRVADEDCIIR